MLTAGSSSAALPAIGDVVYGGTMAGVIDTTKGNIIAADAYQSGLRYLLIAGPKSLESTAMKWRSSVADVPQAKTRWDGLAATQALATTTFPAFDYCAGLTYPSDGGSPWYLSALDEFELVYRYFKPTTGVNQTGARAVGTFPGATASHGENVSSDPVGVAYTTTDPAQTTVASFQSGGSEALITTNYYWTATWCEASTAWMQRPSSGEQANGTQTSFRAVRPVRRVLL